MAVHIQNVVSHMAQDNLRLCGSIH